ncbi:hypothetical protein Tco_0629513 [Tanacetum coccineum]|uniref:Tf2-1-like SH3-like domain-containing protein n=1 Tax=Tanacetum coccineum TaxID=301880 RepID=A0ABQ4WTE7_9ASTR
MTPFYAVYGRLSPSIIPYPSGSTKVAVVEELLMERDALLRQLKQSLAQAKNRMVMQTNRKRRDVEYKTGDVVLVKLQPYRQVTLAKRCSNKLAKKYYGPFKVLEHIGKVAYRLALPESRHPVKQPLAICDSRVVLHQGLLARQGLVQWMGSSPEEATWEWLFKFQEAYPSYHLKDKVISEGEENVMPMLQREELAPAKSGALSRYYPQGSYHETRLESSTRIYRGPRNLFMNWQ